MSLEVAMNQKVFLISLFFIFLNCLYAQEGKEVETSENIVTKSFGTFALPNDWVELTEISRNGKYFYSHSSERNNLPTTNISIEMGTNRYTQDQAQKFSRVIIRQFVMQTGGRTMAINALDTYTEQNYFLFGFTLDIQNPHITTTQYYIVGDRRHILIHLTDFHIENITNAREIARMIANSFKWTE